MHMVASVNNGGTVDDVDTLTHVNEHRLRFGSIGFDRARSHVLSYPHRPPYHHYLPNNYQIRNRHDIVQSETVSSTAEQTDLANSVGTNFCHIKHLFEKNLLRAIVTGNDNLINKYRT
ncbi:hypothetical protein DBV15_06794 [Temnothorax longispinosus]|uniref:Uncharacterized protein n=1 Tax=Temnothorax longispinosus TaxID=300112 RepID=A0A4S2KY69_9HYME|nr:hypothetical protein DBV15_06794 [Temnothorax longispinosus]